MLIEFKVKNFLSFNKQVTFSMVASANDHLKENTVKINDSLDLLTTSVITGNHFSGKTNVVKALGYLQYLVVSNSATVTHKINENTFFGKQNQPTQFDISFIANGNIYEYKIAICHSKIFQEELKLQRIGKVITLIKRKYQNIYFDTEVFEDVFIDTENDYLNYRPILSLLKSNTNNNIQQDIFTWFDTKNYFVYYDSKDFLAAPFYVSEHYNLLYAKLIVKSKVVDFLKSIDFNLQDLNFSRGYPILGIEAIYDKKRSLEIHGESLLLLYIVVMLFSILEKGGVLIWDDLSRYFHPLVLTQIIKLFHCNETNLNNAQLIFTDRQASILNSDLLRKDQIWFTENNNSTSLYSLADFKDVSDNEDFNKKYLRGNYGSIPLFPFP